MFGATCTDDTAGRIFPGLRGDNGNFHVTGIISDEYSNVNYLLQNNIATGDWIVQFYCDDGGNNNRAVPPTATLRVVAANADTTPPTLTITNSHQSIAYNTDITKSSITTLFGITCTDTESTADYTYTSNPAYDKTTADDYTLTFTCTNGASPALSAPTQTRTLTVQAQTTADTTPPTLTITNSHQSIAYNTDITKSSITTLFGITCTDTESTADYTYTSNPAYDKTTADDYTLTFTCTNGASPALSAPTQTRTLTVQAQTTADTTPPTLTITNSHQSIAYNTDITKSSITTLFGITCTDTESTADYTYTSNPAYDKTTADDYTLTFTCTNGASPALSAPTQTRTLTVQADNTPPPNTTPTPTPTPSTTNPSESIPPPPNTGSQIFVDLWHVQVKSPYGSGAVWETYLLERDISGWEKTYEVTKIAFLKAGYYDVNGNFLYGFGEWKTIYLNSQSP